MRDARRPLDPRTHRLQARPSARRGRHARHHVRRRATGSIRGDVAGRPGRICGTQSCENDMTMKKRVRLSELKDKNFETRE